MGLQLGPRFVSLRDRLTANEATTSLPQETGFDISDSFGTKIDSTAASLTLCIVTTTSI